MNLERWCEHEKACPRRNDYRGVCNCGLDDELEKFMWKPIATAPRESSNLHILVWTPANRCTALVVWSKSSGMWMHAYSHDSLDDEPSHWMFPLPGPFIEKKSPEDIALSKICACGTCQNIGRMVIAAMKEQK